MANENLMNSQNKAHTQASRDGHEAAFGKKCHWHGGQPAVAWRFNNPPNSDEVIWLCDECYKASLKEVWLGSVQMPRFL